MSQDKSLESPGLVWYELDPSRLVLERDAMKMRFPQFRMLRKDRMLFWDGVLTSNLGNQYRVAVRYPDEFPNLPPKVFPIDPVIQVLSKDGGRDLKHQYVDGSLCLFHPNERFFEKKSTAVTVLAAAATWFVAYEYWLHSDKTIWPGQEAEHWQ